MSKRSLDRMAKRIFDLGIVLIFAPAWMPLLVITGLVIRLRLGSPVFFCQLRPGLNSKVFRMWKFRTMTEQRGLDGQLLPDERRLTSVGRFLRSSSLDELPELYNVLLGEMSLVGPRPLLVQYLSRYSAFQARRHEVKPGITGLAQIKGRNAISWDEKFIWDVRYVDTRSLLLDLKILAITLTKVVRRDGISSPGNVTMPEFFASSPVPKNNSLSDPIQ